MAIPAQYQSDVDAILSRRHDLGADYWTTPDARIMKGAPFSTPRPSPTANPSTSPSPAVL